MMANKLMRALMFAGAGISLLLTGANTADAAAWVKQIYKVVNPLTPGAPLSVIPDPWALSDGSPNYSVTTYTERFGLTVANTSYNGATVENTPTNLNFNTDVVSLFIYDPDMISAATFQAKSAVPGSCNMLVIDGCQALWTANQYYTSTWLDPSDVTSQTIRWRTDILGQGFDNLNNIAAYKLSAAPNHTARFRIGVRAKFTDGLVHTADLVDHFLTTTTLSVIPSPTLNFTSASAPTGVLRNWSSLVIGTPDFEVGNLSFTASVNYDAGVPVGQVLPLDYVGSTTPLNQIQRNLLQLQVELRDTSTNAVMFSGSLNSTGSNGVYIADGATVNNTFIYFNSLNQSNPSQGAYVPQSTPAKFITPGTYNLVLNWVTDNSFTNNKPSSMNASNTTTIMAVGKPGTPQSVAASDGTKNSVVTVTWAQSLYSTGYFVFRDGALVQTINDPSTVQYDDAPGDPNAHTYQVQSFNASFQSGLSVGDSGFANLPPTGTTLTLDSTGDKAVAATPTVIDPNPTGDTWTFSVLTQPTNGVASIDQTTGKVVFAPTSGWSGSDSFTYRVTDKAGGTTDGTAAVTACSPPKLTNFTYNMTDPSVGGTAEIDYTSASCSGFMTATLNIVKTASGEITQTQTSSSLLGSSHLLQSFSGLASMGANTLKLTMTDAKGNSTSASLPIVASCAMPTLSNPTFTANAVTGFPEKVTGDLGKIPCNGTVKAEVTVNKLAYPTNPVATSVINDTPQSFAMSFGLANPANKRAGDYVATIKLTDVWGQIATQTLPMTVVCPAITASITGIKADLTMTTDQISTSYVSSDVCSGVVTRELKVYDLSSKMVASGNTTQNVAPGTKGNIAFNFSGLPQGDYVAKLKLVDTLGQATNVDQAFNVGCPMPVIYGIQIDAAMKNIFGAAYVPSCGDPSSTQVTITMDSADGQLHPVNTVSALTVQQASSVGMNSYQYFTAVLPDPMVDGNYVINANLVDKFLHSATAVKNVVVDWNTDAGIGFTNNGKGAVGGTVAQSFGFINFQRAGTTRLQPATQY